MSNCFAFFKRHRAKNNDQCRRQSLHDVLMCNLWMCACKSSWCWWWFNCLRFWICDKYIHLYRFWGRYQCVCVCVCEREMEAHESHIFVVFCIFTRARNKDKNTFSNDMLYNNKINTRILNIVTIKWQARKNI